MSDTISTQEARELGTRIATLVNDKHRAEAYALLAPVITERTAFRLLDSIGETIGNARIGAVNAFLDHIAAHKTMGGWVVIASALRQQVTRDLPGTFARCRKHIIAADVWYAADILGERVPGPALVADFDRTFSLLATWREDQNRWVRRSVGVAVHFWAKRSRGAAKLTPLAENLLTFLEPMFEERDMDAVKGIGWGLKTLGKHYPDLVSVWLTEQTIHRRRNPRMLMLNKARTYLEDGSKMLISG